MDIAKFLEDQKFCKVAISGLLTPAQQMFCAKQAKQVVRHGNVRSTYSSEEDQFNSDDSVLGAARQKVGVTIGNQDRYPYVDSMTNRMNETDARLLRGAINDKPKDKPSLRDDENGLLASAYLTEKDSNN